MVAPMFLRRDILEKLLDSFDDADLAVSLLKRLARSLLVAFSDTEFGSMNACGKIPHLPLALVPDQHQ